MIYIGDMYICQADLVCWVCRSSLLCAVLPAAPSISIHRLLVRVCCNRGSHRLCQARIPASRLLFHRLLSSPGWHVGWKSRTVAGVCVAAALRANHLQIQPELHNVVWWWHGFFLWCMLTAVNITTTDTLILAFCYYEYEDWSVTLAEKCCESNVQKVTVTGTVSNIFVCRWNTRT